MVEDNHFTTHDIKPKQVKEKISIKKSPQNKDACPITKSFLHVNRYVYGYQKETAITVNRN